MLGLLIALAILHADSKALCYVLSFIADVTKLVLAKATCDALLG